MPYKSLTEVKKKHPSLEDYSEKAQKGWMKAWNNAWESKKDESYAFAVAWSVANKIDGKGKKTGMNMNYHIVKELIGVAKSVISRKEKLKALIDEGGNVVKNRGYVDFDLGYIFDNDGGEDYIGGFDLRGECIGLWADTDDTVLTADGKRTDFKVGKRYRI